MCRVAREIQVPLDGLAICRRRTYSDLAVCLNRYRETLGAQENRSPVLPAENDHRCLRIGSHVDQDLVGLFDGLASPLSAPDLPVYQSCAVRLHAPPGEAPAPGAQPASGFAKKVLSRPLRLFALVDDAAF